MENYWLNAILFRVFLPCAISIASFIRPTITSYVYTVMGCYMPFFSVPTSKTMAGSTGSFLKLLITVCLLMCLTVYSGWLILFFSVEPQYQFEPCSDLEKLIRTVGVISFTKLPIYELIIWCVPEPLMLLVCIFLYFGFGKLTRRVEQIGTSRKEKLDLQTMEINRTKLLQILFNVAKYFTCLMLCLTAILKPSAFGAVYYIMFLTLLTYWACDRTLGTVFARILACLVPIIFLNITIMIFYQFQYFHDSELFSADSIWGRLFHLVELKTYKDCTDPRIFKFYPHSDATYAMLACLFVLYQLVILVAREILQAKDGISSFLLVIFRCDCKRNRVAARWRQAIKKVRDNLENRKASTSAHLMADRVKYWMNQVMQLLMAVAYVFANIVTMVWAITYVSWSSLILLFWANIVWLLPFRRKVMLGTSPFLVFFTIILLLSNYAYSLDLTRDELPMKIGIFEVSILVPNAGKVEWWTQLTKSLLAFVIFASMRQYRREKQEAKYMQSSMFDMIPLMRAVKSRLNTSFMTRFQNLAFQFLGLWWIWIVTVTMIGIVFWSKVTLFKIVFIGLVIVFLMTFQILPFDTWKKFLKIYWWVAVVYALANLLLSYMAHIEGTRDFLQSYLSERWYEAFHFEIFENATDRFAALVWPLFLQIGILIQQNFFQEEFNRITSPLDPEQEEQNKEKNSAWSKLVSLFRKILDLVFAALEAYILKLILLIGWYMCLFDMCALFVPVVALLIVACLLGEAVAKPVVHSVSFWVQMLILLRLIYTNQYRSHHEWNFTVDYGENKSVTLNSADWFGLHPSSKGMDTADFWQSAWCFAYVFAVVMHRIVTIRMANRRFSTRLPKPGHAVMFPQVTWKNCHDSTGNLLKFLANYGFYKFGCEITLVFASVVMAIRMDAVAILIAVWLLVLFALSRKWTKRFWLVFVFFLAILVLLEYLNTLGWWPTFYDHSLTEFWNSRDLHLRLQQFCQISNLVHPPVKAKISLDFLLLLLACRQWFAFGEELENAGSNDNVCHLIEDPLVENPVPDFMTHTSTAIDSYKNIVFTSGYYVALISIFLAGTLRPTLFSFGNIIASFIFLWEGSDMFLRPANVILRRWNCLIAYNVIVMLVRSASQIFECILIYEDDVGINCKISRLFTIGCVDSYGMMADIPGISTKSACKVVKTTLGLGWDCFSFFCSICQQRTFKSFHFFHVVNNAKARRILADRGATLIEEQRRAKRIAVDVERVALQENIRRKVERIRANGETIEEIRRGGYYRFDRVEKELDIPLVPDKEEEESDYESFDPMPLTEYFGLYHSSSVETVLEVTALRKRRKKILRQKLANKALDLKEVPSKLVSGASREKDPTKTKKVILLLMFVWGAFESLIVSTTNVINRRTKKFRYILKEMHKDLKILQENTNFTQGVRLGEKQIWHPSQSYKDVLTNLGSQAEFRSTRKKLFTGCLDCKVMVKTFVNAP